MRSEFLNTLKINWKSDLPSYNKKPRAVEMLMYDKLSIATEPYVKLSIAMLVLREVDFVCIITAM
jgi:hypothetical protein